MNKGESYWFLPCVFYQDYYIYFTKIVEILNYIYLCAG